MWASDRFIAGFSAIVFGMALGAGNHALMAFAAYSFVVHMIRGGNQ